MCTLLNVCMLVHMKVDMDMLHVYQVSGREKSYCDAAHKILRATGALPVGMSPNRWSSECGMLSWNNQGAISALPRVGGRGISRRGAWRPRADDPPEGDGSPGQWTRWAGQG